MAPICFAPTKAYSIYFDNNNFNKGKEYARNRCDTYFDDYDDDDDAHHQNWNIVSANGFELVCI